MNWLQGIAFQRYASPKGWLRSQKIPSKVSSSNWLLRLADYEEYRESIEQASNLNPYPFKDWFDANGRAYIPFGREEDSIDDDVAGVLEDEQCVITDYRGGYCQQGKRVFRINKVLNSAKQKAIQEIQDKFNNGEIYDLDREVNSIIQYYDGVINTFVNSIFRSNKKQFALSIVISQNPHDVAQMSTDRDWTSCMELGAGSHSKDVFCEVSKGGLVAYLIHSDDVEIQKPLARIGIKRFVNKSGNSVALPENSVYGNDMPGFLESVREWLNSKQEIDPGFYRREGGEYSDTFSRTQLVSPQNIEGILKWYNGDDPSAQFSTWTVTDNLYSTEVAWDENGEEETEFDTHEEAKKYVDNRDYDDSWRDYYGGEWVKVDEETGEYVNERYSISENSHDYRSEMKREAIKTILDTDRGTYPMELIKQIKADLEFTSKQGNYRNATLRKQFAEKYPELMNADDYFRMGYNEYYAYISKLPEGVEKDQLKAEELETVSAYLQNPMQLFDEDAELSQQIQALRMSTDVNSTVQLTDSLSLRFSIIFDDKILKPLQELFKPIPNPVIEQLVNFANNIENVGLNDKNSPIRRKKRNYDTQIVSRIMHTLDQTHSDTPTVQKFYWDAVNSPRFGDNHYGNENYSAINVETVGSSIARLGINGQQFLPWAQQKLQEEQSYYTQMQGLGHSDFSAEGHAEKQSKKNIERYLYIIDAIQNGTGHSTKYRFF